jgi:peptidyl-tRNA hydrolase, PTH1 family
MFHSYRIGVYTEPDLRLVLIQPLTYMNLSGRVLPHLGRRFDIASERTVVVCDNLDLPPGRIRLKRGGGTAGHNGLSSIIEHLGSKDFLRLYIGIGRPESRDVVAHVLGIPDAGENEMHKTAIERAADAVLALRYEPTDQVMNEFNRQCDTD